MRIISVFLLLSASAVFADSIGEQIMSEVNRLRRNEGLESLRDDEEARLSADRHAEELADRRTLSHRSADGRRVAERYRALGGSGLKAGENLGAGNDPAAILNGWMQSSSHRQNMLNSEWTSAGVGYRILEGGRLLVVMVFTNSRWSNYEILPAPDRRDVYRISADFHEFGEIGTETTTLSIRNLRYSPRTIEPIGERIYRISFDIPATEWDTGGSAAAIFSAKKGGVSYSSDLRIFSAP